MNNIFLQIIINRIHKRLSSLSLLRILQLCDHNGRKSADNLENIIVTGLNT